MPPAKIALGQLRTHLCSQLQPQQCRGDAARRWQWWPGQARTPGQGRGQGLGTLCLWGERLKQQRGELLIVLAHPGLGLCKGAGNKTPLDPAVQEQWEFRCWRQEDFHVPLYRYLAASLTGTPELTLWDKCNKNHF